MTIFDNPVFKSNHEILKALIPAVERGYAAMKRPDGIIEKTSFSPSSIGYKHNRCPRLWAMKFAGKYESQETTSLQSLGVMDAGTVAHERIQNALTEAGVVKELEYDLRHDDPPIHGYVDAIVELDGHDVVVEIKTTRTEAWQSRANKMVGPAYQMYQLLTYMYLLKIDRGVLLYENSNDRRLLAVPVDMTDENRTAVENMFEWLRKVWKAHQDGLMPARPWKMTSPNCADCPLFNACWGENAPPEDIKIRSMAVHPW